MFVGLVALDEIAHHCIQEPYQPTFALRATLAMLYAFSDGQRLPFDNFWRDCRLPNTADDPHHSRLMRSNAVRADYNAIARGVGAGQTIAFVTDIAAARHDPDPGRRCWEAAYVSRNAADVARARYADMLRRTR